MEPKPVTSLVGDLGGATQSGVETVAVNFNYQGVAYTIELDPAGAEVFDRAMAPYIAASRRIGGIRAEPARSRQPSENQAIRAWAAANDVPLQPRGRIPNAVRQQYEKALDRARNSQG